MKKKPTQERTFLLVIDEGATIHKESELDNMFRDYDLKEYNDSDYNIYDITNIADLEVKITPQSSYTIKPVQKVTTL